MAQKLLKSSDLHGKDVQNLLVTEKKLINIVQEHERLKWDACFQHSKHIQIGISRYYEVLSQAVSFKNLELKWLNRGAKLRETKRASRRTNRRTIS